MDYSATTAKKQLLNRLGVAAAAFLSTVGMTTNPSQAQNIQAIDSSTVGAQVEYNNTWGQSFEATGPGIQGGGSNGSIRPFANVYTPGEAIQGDNQNSNAMHHSAAEGYHPSSENYHHDYHHGDEHHTQDHHPVETSPVVVSPIILPNSGIATFTAKVTDLTLNGGILEADGKIVASSGSNNIILNQSPTDGVPSITFNPRELDGTDPSLSDVDTLAANILGTNIGVSSIQVTGTNSYTVINTLSAF